MLDICGKSRKRSECEAIKKKLNRGKICKTHE